MEICEGKQTGRHYLLEELSLTLQAGQEYQALLHSDEVDILVQLRKLAASHEAACLALCKHMSKKKNWYSADSLFYTRRRQQKQQVSGSHDNGKEPEQEEGDDEDMHVENSNQSSTLCLSYDEIDKIVDYLVKEGWLEELSVKSPYNLAWRVIEDCFRADDLTGLLKKFKEKHQGDMYAKLNNLYSYVN